MIAWIEGVLREKAPTRIVVDVRGVGYELLVPLSTFETLPDPGKTISLHVHTVVREDVLQLHGFASPVEREAFLMLLRASRVGPKLAQGVLSGIAPTALIEAIRDGNVSALRGIPGVGQKTAERIVVELRDRATELAQELVPGESGGSLASGDPTAEALSALINLGVARPKAERAVEAAIAEAEEGAPIEALIRSALRSLGS